MSNIIHHGVNWNEHIDGFTQWFWERNLLQFWTDTEMSPLKDVKTWKLMSNEEQAAYKYALAGLTLLDTKQGTVGMPKIADAVEDLQRKSVLSFMGMMENIHAKSYSTIFTTLLVKEEIDELFNWIDENKYLQYKANRIVGYYENINSLKNLYMAMIASVYLESFLFYSGFFYPLYLAGQAKGKMIHSGEIINLILRDESIHGVYIGMLAQDIYQQLSQEDKMQVDKESIILLEDLMANEALYTEELYSPIGLDSDVKHFLRYNANKALMNLGKEPYYEEEEINPIVQNGIDTTTVTHDFFSTKGNGYQRGIVEPLRNEDFHMNIEDEFIMR